MRNRRGMTFIEILLLLALLTCMLLILLPAVVSARGKGRKTQCMSNLRQISMALELYSHSYDGRLPPWLNRRRDAFGHTTKWDNPELLYRAIRRGVSESAVVWCPNDPIPGKDEERYGINHRYSSYYFGMRPDDNVGRVTLEGLIVGGRVTVGPAEYVMVRDANMAFVKKLPGKPRRGCEHFGGVNAVYLDGHAKWIR